MTIQPIVEGYGEVQAVPILLRRLRDAAGAFTIDVGPPVRRGRADLVDESRLRQAIRIALVRPDCHAILVLLDADDDCPAELAPRLRAWAESEAAGCPIAVVLANREYEAWFLAGLESLRGRRGVRQDATAHPDPEAPRGAKERLTDQMRSGSS